MSKQDLVMPRRLAIRILHEAQIAQPESIKGWVRGTTQPQSYHAGEPPAGAELWARLWSNPLSPAVPEASQLSAGGLHLVISLNIKGVLEMRAWQLEAGAPSEQVLKIDE
ncbi:MAG: hypothetical protein V4607_08400 [Pseudomonadota bacterium]